MSVDFQVNVKSQSELDIGGCETSHYTLLVVFHYWALSACTGHRQEQLDNGGQTMMVVKFDDCSKIQI